MMPSRKQVSRDKEPPLVSAAAPSASPPAWIYKRDGRLVPFEPDKISRALFAVTESLGKPDAFLARELADGVIHFLAADGDEAIPTTAHLAELVVKVVRELGRPPLAAAFAQRKKQKTAPPAPAALGVRDASGTPPFL